MNTTIIRPATRSDHQEISRLLTEASLPAFPVLNIEDGLVAYLNGELAGFIALERYGAHALLRSAVVRDADRGHGVGKELTSRLLDRARSLDVRDVYLLTLTADRFFERFGFSRVHRSDVPEPVLGSNEFAGACPENARAYRLSLRKATEEGARLKDIVREAYGQVASGERRTSGCGCNDTFADSYAEVPGYVADADFGLGCGIPTTIAALRSGEVVLDLGSGAGIDAFVAARDVGETGRVIGIDFTPEMVQRARDNARSLEIKNVEFFEGDIEEMPLPDASVDVVISNCVLNLVPDKARAFREMHRVLRPGGRFIVSDIVLEEGAPSLPMGDADLYASCVSGALPVDQYVSLLELAGFENVGIASRRPVSMPDSGCGCAPETASSASTSVAESLLLSCTVRGSKPLRT